MKKVLASVLVVVAMLMGTMAQAWAVVVEVEKSDSEWHGHWESYQLDVPHGPLLVLKTSDRDKQSSLEINFLTGELDNNLDIFINFNRNIPGIEALHGQTVAGEILVGKCNLGDVSLVVGDGHIGFYDSWYTTLLLRAAVANPSESIKIKLNGLPKTLEYPLNGFNESLKCWIDWRMNILSGIPMF